MRLATFPHLRMAGWDGVSSPKGLTRCRLEPWADWVGPHPTDALGVAYRVPDPDGSDGGPFPYLTMDALPALVAANQGPLLHWAIFDVDNPGHTPWPDAATARAALDAALPPGWGGYTTPRGLRVLVPLELPLPVQFGESLLRQVSAAMGLLADEKCFDWTRRFYLPRCRRDGVDLEAYVVAPTGTLNPYDYPLEASPERAAPSAKSAAPVEPHELDWEDRRHAAGIDWLLRGEPVPVLHNASAYDTAKATLALIAQRGRYEDPEKLYSFLAPSAAATVGSSVADLGGLWRLCVWIAERQAATNAQPRETADLPAKVPPSPSEWAAVKAALRGEVSKYLGRLQDGQPLAHHRARYQAATAEASRALVERTSLPADAVYRVVCRSVDAQQEPLLPEVWERIQALANDKCAGEDANDATRRAFVAMHPLTLASLEGRLYQLVTASGEYVRTSEQLIEKHFRTYTQPGLPFEADYTGASVRDILTQYGEGIHHTVYVSGRKGTTYDVANKKVVEGVHVLVPCRPEFDAEVDTWLRLLGGSDPEGLLDWLACVTYTYDQPLCALYLRAPPGVGKSLLARGIASLWGATFADYNAIANSNFNADALASPLLFADEGVEVDQRDNVQASRTFKNLTSGQSLTINAKFQQTVAFHGSLRVIVAANDDDGLPFKENLGRDGVDSITVRVRYIRCDPAAKDYLDALGGRAAFGEDWAPQDNSPGRIARHLLWLRDNRTVVPGARFLVEGVPTRWHSQYAARQGVKPYVLQVVFALLQARRRGATTTRVHEREGLVWCSPKDVLEHWNAHTEARKPKPSVVVDALTQMATDKGRLSVTGHPDTEGYGIPPQAFYDAEVADPDDFPTAQTRSHK